jgi:hypothetical protein
MFHPEDPPFEQKLGRVGDIQSTIQVIVILSKASLSSHIIAVHARYNMLSDQP